MKLIKKLRRTVKNRWIVYKKDYPRKIEYYTNKFVSNGWEVSYNGGSYSQYLTVRYDGVKVAHVDKKEYKHELDEIKMTVGYEKMLPLVIQILHAAAREGINKELEEQNKVGNLIKKAYRETEWLGPF